MCGRYVTVTKVKEIEKRFGINANGIELKPSANVAAGQLAPVITNLQPKELSIFTFGFTPSWAQKKMYVINARSEGDHNKEDDVNYRGTIGIISKPMFRSSIRSKRCLVIADAFIEGPKAEKLNKPFCVYMRNKDERPFAFAGIWNEWVDKTSGEIFKSFAIITTQANSLTQKIGHHRSPVILNQEDEALWLDTDAELSDITSLLRPMSGDRMNAYPIASEIKSPKNDSLHLLQPIGERVFKEYDYELYSSLNLEGMGAAPARQRRLFED
jgi:putative SOS response-associated peptidase YedK